MNEPVYLDNAATTALDPEVLEAMLSYMKFHFGNPSSSYSLGRAAKSAIEAARKTCAKILSVKPSTLIFTNGEREVTIWQLRQRLMI